MARGLRGSKGETNSIEDAVPAVFRDPGWGGGEGGSGHVLVDVVDESSAETSAEKLSLAQGEWCGQHGAVSCVFGNPGGQGRCC